MNVNNFLPAITCPTKFNKNNVITKYALIDHIWINFINSTTRSYVLNYFITDHFPIFVQFTYKTRSFIDRITFRDFSVSCLNNFRDSFDRETYEDIMFERMGSNVLFNSVYNRIFSIFDSCCPIKTKIVTEKRRKPWICKDLMFCINKKFELIKMYKNELITIDVLNEYKNKLDFALKLAKELYYLGKLINCNNNVKKTWKFINSFSQSKNKSDLLLRLNDVNGLSVPTNNICDYINDFFINAVPINNNFSVFNLDYMKHSDYTVYLMPVVPDEIIKIVNSFPNKNTHINDIPVFVLKLVLLKISELLSYLFNECISEGIYPDTLKVGRVIPIFKSGDSTNISNYRPISTLLTVNKIFEKILHNRLVCFFEYHNIINEYQFEFRKTKVLHWLFFI